MDRFSKLILKSLLKKGYFPKELPSVFTTESFAQHAEEVLKEWEKTSIFQIKRSKDFGRQDGKFLSGRYGYKKLTSADPEIISKPKRLYERRNIHITHPVPQAILVREIAENWKKVQKFLSIGMYSDDEIVISDQYERSIKGINFKRHRAKKNYIESTADWLVKTDISRFYPSIYTHSIPWAAYGKEKVKSHIKVYEGSFADRLDVLVRACNRNQTVGIPIGPETSRIIAEIISSRVDFNYSKLLPNSAIDAIDRLQDDWLVGANTLEDSEKILSVISSCYRDFGLEINGSKTSITHILSSAATNWKSEISAFLSHRKGALDGSRLEEFLNLCVRLQLESSSEPVLNYALAIVENRQISKDDIQILESFLLKSASIAPGSMDRICRIILNIEHQAGGLSKGRLVNRFTSLAERHFENGALFEVMWLLYTIRGLKRSFVSSRIMKYAEDVQSSAIRLLILDMHMKKIFLSKPPISKWENEISEERVLSDWSWLYAYEAIRKGWMHDAKGIMSKSLFKPLNDRNIIFYDENKNVRSSRGVSRTQQALRRHQQFEVVALMNFLRKVDVDDRFSFMEYY